MAELFAIIPAAGSGQRLGQDKPKALVELLGQPIVSRTLSALCTSASFRSIVVTVPPGCSASLRAAVEGVSTAGAGLFLIEGGSTRQASVKLALSQILMLGARSEDLVLIHDAARCLVSAELVNRMLEAGARTGAASAGINAKDSVKEVNESGLVVRSLQRSALRLVQTPQVFRVGLLLRAHEQLEGEFTDDASMVELFHPVVMVEGEERNFKITTKEDLSRAAMLLS